MKRSELDEWMLNHEFVTYESFYDECGNCDVAKIYADSEGRLFMIEFCNDHPYEKWGEHGFIRGEYDEPIEVVKKTRIVEYYEPKGTDMIDKNSLPGDLPCQINPNVTKKDIMDALLRHCKASKEQLDELCKQQPELLEQIKKEYPDFKL